MKHNHAKQYDDAVKDVISELVESETMRRYLLRNAQKLRKRQIVEFICGNRTALKRKVRFLERLATALGKEKNEPGGFRESTADI